MSNYATTKPQVSAQVNLVKHLSINCFINKCIELESSHNTSDLLYYVIQWSLGTALLPGSLFDMSQSSIYKALKNVLFFIFLEPVFLF